MLAKEELIEALKCFGIVLGLIFVVGTPSYVIFTTMQEQLAKPACK
jgi:hypothetical protein